MILEMAVLQVRPGRATEFEAAFREAEPIIAGSPGHVSHELHRCVEDPDRFLLLVRWRTLEDHTRGFRGSPGYQRWKALPGRLALPADGRRPALTPRQNCGPVHGAPLQTSGIAPCRCQNASFSAWTAGMRGVSSCGSWPSRGGRFSSGESGEPVSQRK
jgi:heme-degrading monooxygenase HmoA